MDFAILLESGAGQQFVIDISPFTTELRSAARQIPAFNRLVLALTRLQDGINQVGTATGTDPNSHTAQPAPPTAINVSSGSDHVHVTLQDTAQHSRAENYFVEWSANDPSFMNPNVEHLGASRGRVLALPAKDGSNNVISYYFRGYKHSLGAEQASTHVVYGSPTTPTAVTLTGSSKLALLTSTGSGTAPTNGQKGGQGFGSAQFSSLPPNVKKAP